MSSVVHKSPIWPQENYETVVSEGIKYILRPQISTTIECAHISYYTIHTAPSLMKRVKGCNFNTNDALIVTSRNLICRESKIKSYAC